MMKRKMSSPCPKRRGPDEMRLYNSPMRSSVVMNIVPKTGGNSVRGYDEDVLGPVNTSGDAIGGSALIVLNGEARFPVFKMLRGVGFLDAGRAFDTVKAIRLSDLSVGTGVGLRVQTPIVLLRIDFGIPLDRSMSPRRGTLFVSVGQLF